MKKLLDKLHITMDKRIFIFFITLLILGIVIGIIFVNFINESDKEMIKEHMINFIDEVNNDSLDNFKALQNGSVTTVLYVVGIWLLGISVIGIPIIIGMFFIKSFIVGFGIGSIFYTYGLKGALFALIYTIPSALLNLLSLLIISMYAISFSTLLIYSILKKQSINFKVMMNKYLFILGISLVICFLTNLYDAYIMPLLLNNFFS